jgi:ribonucleoside-diphosphate reductase alpha chain
MFRRIGIILNKNMSNIYWLNKDSRTFLERGYLVKDETPEQRISDIANAAKKYLGEE